MSHQNSEESLSPAWEWYACDILWPCLHFECLAACRTVGIILQFPTKVKMVKMVKNCDQMTMMDYEWICKVTWTPRRHPMNIFKCTKSASWNVYCVEPLCLTCCFADTFIYSIYYYISYIPTSNLPLPHLDLGVAISWTWWSGHSNLTHWVSMGLYSQCSMMVLVPDAAWCSCIPLYKGGLFRSMWGLVSHPLQPPRCHRFFLHARFPGSETAWSGRIQVLQWPQGANNRQHVLARMFSSLDDDCCFLL